MLKGQRLMRCVCLCAWVETAAVAALWLNAWCTCVCMCGVVGNFIPGLLGHEPLSWVDHMYSFICVSGVRGAGGTTGAAACPDARQLLTPAGAGAGALAPMCVGAAPRHAAHVLPRRVQHRTASGSLYASEVGAGERLRKLAAARTLVPAVLLGLGHLGGLRALGCLGLLGLLALGNGAAGIRAGPVPRCVLCANAGVC